ncbi:uncharacterized protein TNCV_2087531 [Trichonephila clavipes]|nr:uncharacterized protein TNCV_2087531 [Trichonephila clavipes]
MGSVIAIKERRHDFIPLNFPVEDGYSRIYALAHPESSLRDIRKACSYSKSTVWNILHTYGAYTYRPVLAQELMPGDQERRGGRGSRVV